MLKRNSRVELLRKRSAAHKVSVSEFARENQIIRISLNISNQLLSQTTINTLAFLEYLNKTFFAACQKNALDNACFIYKDKLPRVMFADEGQVFETQQQLIFMYHPKRVFGHKSMIDEHNISQNVQLLFLAQGQQLRYNAARFHQKVQRLLEDFALQVGIATSDFEFHDEQHLTFDIFSRNKGERQNIIHGFRPLTERYLQQSFIVPRNAIKTTFAVATIPIKRALIGLCDIDQHAQDPFNPLYTYLNDLFNGIAKQYNLNQHVLIADAKIPVLSQDNENYVLSKGELVFLGVNNQTPSGGYACQWDPSRFNDEMTIVFVANEANYSKRGYGRFVNHICEALRTFASQLSIDKKNESIMLRFHQHMTYRLGNRADAQV